MSHVITSRRSLVFRIESDALYVANFGRRFDRRGVISVCRENLSAKTGRGPGSSLDEVSDRDLVAAIRERRLNVYKADVDQLQEDANHERETSSDYAGRSLWELLQNADDALAPAGTSSADLIGAKGLGFKSVLEITERPSIHSGAFDFGFDAAASRSALRVIDPTAPDLTFRLPHAVTRDDTVKELMRRGFSTVVRLPFRSEKVAAGIADRLGTLAPHFLLLCRNLDEVTVENGDGPSMSIGVSRPRSLHLRNAPASLSVVVGGETTGSDWRIWSTTAPAPREDGKSLSAAIAIPIVGGVAAPAAEDIPVHVFFPTAESVAARFLVHGSFALTSNRNNIKLSDQDDAVRAALQHLVEQVAEDIPATSVVRLFGEIVRSSASGRARRADRLIQQAIGSTVRSAAFIPLIGGGHARPGDVRTWEHDLYELVSGSIGRKLHLPTPELLKVFADLRTIFGAEPLRASDYAALLAELKIDTVAKSLRAIRVAHAACLSSVQPTGLIEPLTRASIWATDDDLFRSLQARPPLLRQRPSEWPEWLPTHALHPEVLELLESYDAAAAARWSPLLSGRLLRSRDDWLTRALAPELADWTDERWETAGYGALSLIAEWASIPEFAELDPLVETLGDGSTRTAIASVARIPTRSGWAPSRTAYAGREINGIHELATYFKAVPGRVVANVPTKASAMFGLKRWKALLRYLGVSWEPKVQLIARDGSLPDQSSSYAFHRATGSGLVHINQEWFIEHFPQCLGELTPSQVATCTNALVTAVTGLDGRWRKMSWADRAHAPAPFTSFADFQLKRERYLPQRPVGGVQGERLAPHELFWPGKGIAGVTPILDVGTINKIRRNGLRPTFVRRLHVRDTLPQDWTTWIEWSDALLTRVTSGQKVPTKAVRDFYDALLRTPERPAGLKPLSRVAATYPDREGDVVLAASADTLWIDSGRFENQETLSGLGEKGKAILPVRLDRGQGAPEVLGVRRASEVLTVTPQHHPASERRTQDIERRLNARRGALGAICRTKNLRLRTMPGVLAVNDLRLRIALEGELLADRSAPWFKEGDRWLINLQSGDKWEAVAAAVSEQFGLHGADLKYRFARILRAGRDEVASILAEDGIPQYRIREALSDLDHEDEPDGQVEDEGHAEAAGDQGDGSGADADDDEHDDADGGGGEGESEEEDGDDTGESDERKAGTGDEDRRERRRLTKRKLFGGGGGDDQRKRRRRDAAEAAEAAASRGLRAESWLMRQVAASLGDEWECSANVRDDDLRETDLLLTRHGAEFHIEVKSLTSERIYWSELEREKAEGNPGRYFMALLTENGDEQYGVRWLWDPLVDLAGLPRRIEWVWRNAEEGPSVSDGWKLESGQRWPLRSADRYIHVIQVTQGHLETLDEDPAGLPELLARVTRAPADRPIPRK